MEKDNFINISDISAWLYCPRKLFISRILRIRKPPTKKIIQGKLKHDIMERFSKNEKSFVETIDKDYDKIDLVFMYEEFIKSIAERIFLENKNLIQAFGIEKDEFIKKTISDFSEELALRISSLKSKLKEGFFKDELWKNLDSLFLAEVRVESEAFQLRGRVDKVEIQKSEHKVIPYELKSREGAIFDSDRIQLTAYAMLLEDLYKTKIKTGIIQASQKKEELEITEENKNKVLEIAESIRKMKGELPPPMLSNFNKCKSCEYQEECMKI